MRKLRDCEVCQDENVECFQWRDENKWWCLQCKNKYYRKKAKTKKSKGKRKRKKRKRSESPECRRCKIHLTKIRELNKELFKAQREMEGLRRKMESQINTVFDIDINKHVTQEEPQDLEALLQIPNDFLGSP